MAADPVTVLKKASSKRRHHVIEVYGWLFCEGCNFYFVAPGGSPGLPEQRARFRRCHPPPIAEARALLAQETTHD